MFEDFAPITAELEKFVKTFDEEYSVALNSDFQSDSIEMRVYYTFAMIDKSAKAFRANFVQRFPACADFDVFTLSFFHELGHLEMDWASIDDANERNTIKDDETYFALYNETIATDWAGEYLTEHHDEMKLWEEKILRMFKKVLDKYPD